MSTTPDTVEVNDTGCCVCSTAMCRQAHFHAAQWFTGIGAYDASSNHARSRACRRRLIPRRRLCHHQRTDEEQVQEQDERQSRVGNNSSSNH